jgi:Protein of unknown function (DUF2934)
MPDPRRIPETVIRETAYYIWEREGRPDGRDQDHWLRAAKVAGRSGGPPSRNSSGREHDHMEEEEKVLAGRPDANMPSLLTKDVPGG